MATETLTQLFAASPATSSTDNDIFLVTQGGVSKAMHRSVLLTLTTPLSVANGGTGAATLTAHGVLVGEGTSAIAATAAMVNGQLLVGQTGADPAPTTLSGDAGLAANGVLTLSTVTVNKGGTGKTSLTAYAVLCGGTTTTGAVQSIASVGTAGQVLTSNGAGALPTFQAAGGGGSPGGADTNVQFNDATAFGGSSKFLFNKTSGLVTVAAAAAPVLAIGPNGATNPCFSVVTNVSSAATGLSVTGNAAGAGVTLTALSSGTDEPIKVVPKGVGDTQFTGQLTLDPTLGNGICLRVGAVSTFLTSNGQLGLNTTIISSASLSIASINSTANPLIGLNNNAGSGEFLLCTSNGSTVLTKIQGDGSVSIAPSVRTSGSPSDLVITGPADTTLTASTEAIGVKLNLSATRQWATGALTTQREVVIQGPTYAFVAASTITTAVLLDLGVPAAGTNATITHAYSLQTAGAINANLAGTVTAPAVCVGAGNTGLINYGGNFGMAVTVAGVATIAWSQTPATVLVSGAFLGWSAGDPTASGADTAFSRAAAGVIRTVAPGPTNCWLQNTAARARMTTSPTNNTATMANLTDLSLTLIAGRKYFGRVVFIAKDSTGADGLQFDFNGGTATMTSFQATAEETPIGATLGVTNSTALGTALTNTVVATTDTIYAINITMVVNAGGTFIPRFAQVSHSTGTATVELGSSLSLEDSPN